MVRLMIVGVLCIGLAGSFSNAESVWREEGYEAFIDGIFEDGGANTYVSAKGRIQTVNRWDLNGDGFIDLPFANTHSLGEAIDMSIYWGNGKDFSIANQTYVPANGCQWATPADLDGDGATDLVVCNYSNGSTTDMDSYVYFSGSQEGASPAPHPFKSKISLPTKAAQNAAVGDFNHDGLNDIAFAFSAGYWEYRTNRSGEYRSPSRIYWGAKEGFNPEKYQDLPTLGAADVAAADLNGDGWLELIFANSTQEGITDIDSYVYWGDPSGFSEERFTGLPTHQASSITIGDVNNDKQLDLVFTNEKGKVSYAYLNQAGTFSKERRLEFTTTSAKDSVVVDFNRDGYTDVFFTQYSQSGNRLTDSVLYFGSPTGFMETNKKLLPTIGGWGVSAADFNKDGWVDLFISNSQEAYSYEVPSFLYWNSPDGFDTARRTCLYEHGAAGNAVADFNGDGNLDILVNSMMSRSRGDYEENYIYWGNAEGQYSEKDRISLPGRDSYEFVMADLNDDGQVEIVFTNSGEGGRKANENWIFWNDLNRFDPWRITGLPGYMTLGIQTADLDRDGWLDLVASDFAVDPNSKLQGTSIWWGGVSGFCIHDKTLIPHIGRSANIADLNEDHYLDLVFGSGDRKGVPFQPEGAAIFWGDGSRNYTTARRTLLPETQGTSQPEVADLNRDGHLDIVFPRSAVDSNALVLYGNDKNDYESAQRESLVIEGCGNCSIADVDLDGWLDILFPTYKSKGPPISRDTLSRIWRGGPQGFDPSRLILLPTDSGTGSLVSDFNRDGYPDVFFYCHRKEGNPEKIGSFGDHLTNSLLYWGGPAGFQITNRLGIPSAGVHNDSGVDIGDIRNRRFEFAYVSSPHETQGTPVSIRWNAEEPRPNTHVRFQIRGAESAEGLAAASWCGPSGEGSYFTQSGETIHLPPIQWLQYRAVLDTGNGASSPILKSVEIRFE